MATGPNPELTTRAELDPSVGHLLSLWRAINKRRLISTATGEIRAEFIAAAIDRGVKTKRIKFTWEQERKPLPPRVTFVTDGQRITVTIDQATMFDIENEIGKKFFPGGVIPPVRGRMQLIVEFLAIATPEERASLTTFKPIHKAIIDTYNYYQQIP